MLNSVERDSIWKVSYITYSVQSIMLRQRFVLDTTALTDSLAWESEGAASICEGMNAILDRVAEGRLHLGISCYIPYPSVYNEIKDFARHNNCDARVLGKVDTWLVKKSPDRYKVKVPSKIFYEYVSSTTGSDIILASPLSFTVAQ